MFGSKSNRFEVIYKETMSGCKIIVDKETGVHYLFSYSGYAGGITPLLDKNGNPVIKSYNEENLAAIYGNMTGY